MYLIPAPAKLEKKEGRFIWAYDRYVTVDQSCSQLVTRQASLFCDGAEKELGYRPLLTRGAAKAGDVVFKQDDTMKAQSYVLDIAEDAIVLMRQVCGMVCRHCCRSSSRRAHACPLYISRMLRLL